jgi:DNA/RNA endonuclease G (NUC1)
MKKIYFGSFVLILLAVWFVFSTQTNAAETQVQAAAQASVMVSPHLVVSQFQTAGATAFDEFVELHNTSSNAVDLNGYRVVYRSAAGASGDVAMVEWTTSTVIPAGGYYLIATSAYDGSTPANITYNTAAVSMSGTGGGIAIRNGAINTGIIIDSLGYGTATNPFIETAVTSAPAANSSQSRLNNACQDTDNNSSDFANTNPSAPRNSGSTPNTCATGGTSILAGGAANPSTLVPGATTLLTVSVLPATTPPSTGIAVVGNLTDIGGSASQTFFDNGTNGDVTPGDNVFSFSATIPAGTVGGIHNVSAVASDAQARTANVNISITVNAPLPDEDPLLLGNPSNATSDVANENNYLMIKPQYSLSYSRANATPNWVAWRLDTSWMGTVPRQDDYRPDPALPAAWYHVTDNDYSGSGYTRGHMCPSADRQNTIPNNSSTFLMTNFVPQIADNNSGPWEDFETYCRSLATSGNEIYIFSGGSGNVGTIAQGRIVVPAVTWKVVLVLPNGSNDLERVNKSTRTIAIIVPNTPPVNVNAPWRNFRTTVKSVEALTGYNFFSNVPINTRQILKRKRDWQ